MRHNQNWNQFLSDLLAGGVERYRRTQEYAYRHRREKQLAQLLRDNLTEDEKQCVDEILLELGEHTKRDEELIYRQGFRDCVWLLRQLGVLA